jgi:Uma2 family endonuclease
MKFNRSPTSQLSPPTSSLRPCPLDDRSRDVEEKIRVYLAAGTQVVFLVDTDREVVDVRDLQGQREIGRDATIEHAALPGFQLQVDDLFAIPKPN